MIFRTTDGTARRRNLNKRLQNFVRLTQKMKLNTINSVFMHVTTGPVCRVD